MRKAEPEQWGTDRGRKKECIGQQGLALNNLMRHPEELELSLKEKRHKVT